VLIPRHLAVIVIGAVLVVAVLVMLVLALASHR
jgi:hypothetical protein